MKQIVLPLTFLGLLTVASADAVRDQINSMNSGVSKAMMRKDFGAIEKIIRPDVAPNFVYIEDGAKGKPMNVDAMLSNMKQGIAMMSKITFAEAKLGKVAKSGDTYTAHSTHKMLGTMVGQDKKTHTMSYLGLSTEVYKMVGGKLLMVSMTMKTGKMTMDGKPALSM